MKKLALLLAIVVCGCDREKSAEQIKVEQNKLQQADAQIARAADAVMATSGRVEGVPELDPWGKQIRVSYNQEWTTEVVTIRSAGPDLAYDTADDLVRVREREKPGSVLKGVPPWAWVAVAWGVCAFLAVGLRVNAVHRSQRKGHRHRGISPVDVLLVMFAPAAVLVYLFFGGIAAIGLDVDFDVFEFDLD